ncbi:MAG: precorrin-8X methylmutase [Gammaproteobacteria bacterium]|nr:precorrin-8X methylmutase [Gammaproteobacteria bacterium]
MPFDYLRDPAAIYARSFELALEASDLSGVPPDLHPCALRLIHACAMPDIVSELRWSDTLAGAARGALAAGAPIIADCEMVAGGITRRFLPAANDVVCTLGDARVPAMAKASATTRSAAAVELWRPRLGGAVVAIGNAPTALFGLLECLEEGAPAPAVILGFPVGFVGAAEAKAALAAAGYGIPFLTLSGRRGGSAMAAAAVNAFALDARQR